MERTKASEIAIEQEAGKIEEEEMDETLAWIEEEERKEREEAERKRQEEEDEKWMLEQLKQEHGDDFGEDIDLDFSE